MSVSDEPNAGPDDDGPDDGPDDGGDAGGAEAGAEGAPAEGRRKRRRRRRRHGEGPAQSEQPGQGQPPRQQQQQQRPPQQPRAPQQQRAREQRPDPGGDRGRRDERGRGPRAGGRGREERPHGRDHDRFRDQRGKENRLDPGQEADLRAESDDILRGDPYRDPRGLADDAVAARPSSEEISRAARDSQPPHLRGSQSHFDDDEVPVEPSGTYGTDDDSPVKSVTLSAEFPADAPDDDPDPVTWPLVDGPGAQLGDDVASVVGIRFVPAGRISWCDAADGDYAPGDRVMVDSDRGPRLAWIATAPTRKTTRDRGLRRVIRRANEHDLRGEKDGDSQLADLLRIAKDKATALRLPLKVFRIEKSGGKLNVYYTSDERLDLRDFVRDVGQATGLRLELRQLGVRDEAKVVGGIGSCGLTLCCTTWLPDFVPVSIKMAKDQGLVLSPTKVSGQCGRLKCCLVYEQAGYAEMRKGLPKLGKRVISPRGEGRVVEVDVLRQRIRVSYGHGDTEVLPASEVKPMFPSGNQPARDAHEPDDDASDPSLPES